MAPAAQRLIYQARPMQDTTRLSDYGKCNPLSPLPAQVNQI